MRASSILTRRTLTLAQKICLLGLIRNKRGRGRPRYSRPGGRRYGVGSPWVGNAGERLERNQSKSALANTLGGGFFLRKKPLGRLAFVTQLLWFRCTPNGGVSVWTACPDPVQGLQAEAFSVFPGLEGNTTAVPSEIALFCIRGVRIPNGPQTPRQRPLQFFYALAGHGGDGVKLQLAALDVSRQFFELLRVC